MARTGIYGFRKNGEDKLTYNRLYSEPSGLGINFINFLLSCTREQLSKLYDNIVLIDKTVKPTEEQVTICTERGWLRENARYESSVEDVWYNLVRNLQHNFEEYKIRCIDADDFVYMTDDKQNFLNSYECLYAYIYDLDANTLEFYKGPYDAKDFATYYIDYEKAESNNRFEKYPPKLFMTLHLDGIRKIGVSKVVRMLEEFVL